MPPRGSGRLGTVLVAQVRCRSCGSRLGTLELE
jgi:hypothetical protein